MLSLLLAFCWSKQAFAWFGFHVGLFGFLRFGCHVVGSGFFGENSAGSLRCRVTSPGSWNLGDCLMLVLRWDGSVVTLLVRRRYGVYTVFDSRGCYLSQPVLRRDFSGPSFRRWRARKCYKRGSRDSRERARTQRVVLNCPGLDIAHRRLVQSERRYGRSPACTAALARHFHVMKNNFYPCIKTLIRFTHL